MIFRKSFLQTEDEKEVLKKRLFDFYNNISTYSAYNVETNQKQCRDALINSINSRFTNSSTIKILEFGAGKSGFYNRLEEIDCKPIYYSQDINNQNIDHLKKISNKVYVGEVFEIEEQFDVIFSTFVFEHLINPEEVLNHLSSLLSEKGMIAIFSPKYDLPFYLSPSASHFSKIKKISIAVWLLMFKIKLRISRKPHFLVHKDPAIFYKDWKRDFDAVHWVQKIALETYCEKKNLNLSTLNVKAKSLYKKFYNKFMLLSVVIDKSDT